MIAGDINRPEVLKSFDVGSAKACVITVDDMSATNKAVINIRKYYPDLPIIVRAKDALHQKRLENMFGESGEGSFSQFPFRIYIFLVIYSHLQHFL